MLQRAKVLRLPFHRAWLCPERGQGLGTLEPGPRHPLGSVGAGRPCGCLHGSSRSVTSEQLSTGTFSDNLRRTLQRGFASLEHGVRKGIPPPHRQLRSLQLGAAPAPSPAPLHGLAPPSGSLGVGPRRKEGYSLRSSRCLDVGRQVPKALLTRKESRENELYL